MFFALQVLVKHVELAYNVLAQSILAVERPDIILDTEIVLYFSTTMYLMYFSPFTFL